jgi:NRAMP (natural resistance-associated macrophage protein)-like metal ion transporter
MDPGNWATDIAGGSRFGYRLLWVLMMSNLMAVLLQTLPDTAADESAGDADQPN